jgi:hypothetical protein
MEMTKILINIPESLANGMTAIGNEYQVSRNRMVVEACRRFLDERPKAIGSLRPSSSSDREWTASESTTGPVDFLSSGTGIR